MTIKNISSNEKKMLKSVLRIKESYKDLNKINFENYSKEDTAIIFIDMIVGFTKKGPLSSKRSNKIIEPIKKLDKTTLDYRKIFFKDSHDEKSLEFDTYPQHCLENSEESNILKFLDYENINSQVIKKNSINGFLVDEFQDWLNNNKDIENYIIVGLVSDICIMNFALTLKAYFNENNLKKDVIVLSDCVETFELEATNHNAELMNNLAFYTMEMNGIKIMRG
ncbi:MAG: isochorismatase family cysteine hydrolase [Bacillota bacterium]